MCGRNADSLGKIPMMKTEYFNIGRNDWGMLLCYDYNISDYDDMWAIMRSFGLNNKKANEALRVLSGLNTGMTISNEDIRMSVVFISETTSESEWWNTCEHELSHVATAIIDYYGEPYDGEPAAHLAGHLLQRVIERISYPCY